MRGSRDSRMLRGGGTPGAGAARSVCPPRARAFTLVELLVVIGVIAVLIGVLLPALSAARKTAQLVASMNNMRQITAAALAYTYDYDERWPVVPIKEPPKGVDGNVYFDSWQFGGKTTSDYWKTYFGGLTYHKVSERPLNTYIYPDVEMVDPVAGTLELEVYRCPADQYTYQRGYWDGDPPLAVSSYDDVGTSYHINLNWWYASARPGESGTTHWARTQPIFRRGGLGGPSRFVWMYDQIMDVVAIYGAPTEGLHGGLNKAKTAFQDGHVVYLQAQPKATQTSEYWLLLE